MERKEPWEAYPSIWKTSAAFFAYLRGALRQVWSRYPAKLAWKQKNLTTTPPEGYTGRGKKFGTCHYCGDQFTASSLEVDHVKQAGTCNSWETASTFLYNLLACDGNWVLACKPCHKVKSYAERMGVSFDEATAEKKAIEYSKKHSQASVVDFCTKMGYNSSQLSNAAKRRKALVEIFKKGGSSEQT